ncbi:MAG: class I SAM-dependent methyltransferase, partial [Candidatus Krumholzibacteria bacterium]|nr:class I SAM-dependent methyltransferase [Candidatus Krumholzibacteria bacterium]
MTKTTSQIKRDFFSYSDRQRSEIRRFLDSVADDREKWINRNRYYYVLLQRLLAFHIPPEHRICHFGCDSGHLLRVLCPSKGVGVCLSEKFVRICTERFSEFKFYGEQWEEKLEGQTFDYIVLTNPGYLFDIQDILERLYRLCHHRTKVLIVNNNY